MSDDVERYIVCNGDADGLCAALQWRWHDPRPATLITGLKRDVELLRRVPPTSAREVVVFDLSMPRNARALTALLEHGVNVRYFDHHAANTPVRHPRLQAHLDSHANVCTCVLVDRYLHGARRAWAVVGAWGDNLASGARRLARLAELSNDQCETLRMLGEAINYNAYGDTEADVLIAPARLYDLLASYRDPLDAAAREPVVAQLMARQADDLRQAKQTATY
ncbi:MAG TPA: hypothetical protein VFS42_07180 [Burkholderiaceae bacterium]|nr:hypothetical protein [Burkholderiaceae bacterium]